MSAREYNESYKGFDIEFFIVPKGFNSFKITITRHRFKGTRREEYYLKMIDAYTSKLAEARKIARKFIDELDVDNLDWRSQGLSKAYWLPE